MRVSKWGFIGIVIASAIVGALLERAYTAREKLAYEATEKEKTRNDIVTIIDEKTDKEGGTSRRTVIVDKSRTDTKKKESLEIVKTEPPKDWLLYGGITQSQVYSIGVQRRILGPIFLGVSADTKSQFGASVGILF